MIYTKTLFFFLFIFLNVGYSQFKNVIHLHFTTKEGLSHNSVGTILKDSKGYLWLGTWNGLNRYDGYNFTVFKPDLKKFKFTGSYRIISLFEDCNNNIWTKTYDEKLLLFNTKTNKFENIFGEKIFNENFKVKNIYENNSTKELIISTYNNGIFIIDPLNNYNILHFVINKHDSIYDIVIDKLNNIWFKSGKNAYLLKKALNNKYILLPIHNEIKKINLNENKIDKIFFSNNLLFFTYSNGNILIYNPITKELSKLYFDFKKNISLIKHYLNNLYIFCINDYGILIYDLNTKDIKYKSNLPIFKKIYSIYVDSKLRIWVETSMPGIYLINPEDNYNVKNFTQKINGDYDIQNHQQCGYFEDSFGNVWINLKGGGFGYYNPKTQYFEYFFNNPNDSKSFLSNKVNAFYYDSTGILWLSTSYKGIDKIVFINNFFNYNYLSLDNKNEKEVRSVYKLSENLLLIGTKDKNLYLCDSNFNIKEFHKKVNGMVYSIYEDKNKNIYFGTKGNGIYILKNHNSKTIENYLFNSFNNYSLSNNNIYAITEDKNHKIWIATYGGGINIYVPDSGNKFFHYNNILINYPFFKGKRVRDIKVDSKNNVWIATTEGLIFGKNHSNIRNIRFITLKNILNDIYNIYMDKYDTIWLATLGGGLYKIKSYPYNSDTIQYENFNKRHGLPTDVILTIIEDKYSRLWLSTENNIVMFDRYNKYFYIFDENDGLINTNFSEAAVCDFNGKLVYGTTNGILSFCPDSLKIINEKVNLVFTSFKLFNEEIYPDKYPNILKSNIDYQNEIKLRYNQNFFTISFVALNYKIQNKIKYKYYLENYDKEWNNTEHNFASYTNVPPGKYKFFVKAFYPGNTESNTKKLIITILPPPWKTKLAYTIYLIISILLSYLTYKIIKSYISLKNKIIIEKELLELKNNFFTTISHELKTPLTLISGPLNEIKENEKLSDKGKNYIKIIEQNTNRMIRLISQLLELRKIQSKDIKLKLIYSNIYELVKNVFLYFEEHARERNINYNLICENTKLNLWFDEEKMEIVIFNLLSNAFKFSPDKSKIEVSIIDSINHVEIRVKDNGIGIPTEKENEIFKPFSTAHENYHNKGITGIGLYITKEIVLKHLGNIYFIRNQNEKGVTFVVSLLKGKDHFNPKEVIFLKNNFPDRNEIPEENNEKPTILIIEDNLHMLDYLKMTLSDEYNITFANNTIDGIEKAIKLNPDIIISDILMPGSDGIELVKTIKNNIETSHIPIIILTALSSLEYKIKGLEAGADAYINKPFNIKQLKAQITNLLSQRKKLMEKFTSITRVQIFENSKEFLANKKDVIFLQNLSKIIEENIENPDLKIDDIASKMGMGRTVFYKKIKGLTGLSPIDFIKEFRLQRAKSLLETGEYNVSEIAYKLGFNDPGYFSKVFSEKFKKPPSLFLKNKNNSK